VLTAFPLLNMALLFLLSLSGSNRPLRAAGGLSFVQEAP
jgi:hypothetical protein